MPVAPAGRHGRADKIAARFIDGDAAGGDIVEQDRQMTGQARRVAGEKPPKLAARLFACDAAIGKAMKNSGYGLIRRRCLGTGHGGLRTKRPALVNH